MTISLFMHFIRLRFREQMEYRGAFLLGLLSQMAGYAATYLVLWLTLEQFSSIAGWEWPDIAFLYSLNLLTYALGAAFTYSQMYGLEEMVQKGTFDAYLIRPLDPFVGLLAQLFNVGYAGHLILSGVILGWSLTRIEVAWTPGMVAFLIASVVSGSCIQAAMLTLIGAWTFTSVKSDVLFWFQGTLRRFNDYPLPIFANGFQVLVTVIFPTAFLNFYPAVIVLDKEAGLFPDWIGWLSPLVGPVMLWVTYRLFMRGMDRYQGAGG